MPLLITLRVLTSLATLVILIAGGYLVWSWYDGQERLVDGALVVEREHWRLLLGVALLASSLLGGLFVRLLLGRPDDDKTRLTLDRGPGEMISSPTGAEIFVERIGDRSRPTLLFTHGWGLDSTIWRYAKRDLADDFNLVFWDLPGLGRSRPGKLRRFDPARFAEDLRAVIDAVAAPDVILIGHSIGGMTVQSFLRDHLDTVAGKIDGVVLLNTTYTNPIRTGFGRNVFTALRRPFLEPLLGLTRLLGPLARLSAWRSYLSGAAHLANRAQFGRSVTRSQLEAVTLLGTRNSQAVQAAGIQDTFRWDATGALKEAPVPVLVIGGENDLVTQIDASRFLAASSAGDLLEAPGVGHNGFLESPELYHQAIRDFSHRVVASSRQAHRPRPLPTRPGAHRGGAE